MPIYPDLLHGYRLKMNPGLGAVVAGALAQTTTILSADVTSNFSSPAQTDWMRIYNNVKNYKATGGQTIAETTGFIANSSSFSGSGNHVIITDGVNPVSNGATGDNNGAYYNPGANVAATVMNFQLPVGTTPIQILLLWSQYQMTGILNLSLSDNSAAPVTFTTVNMGNSLNTVITTNAASAGQVLTINISCPATANGNLAFEGLAYANA